MRSCGRRVVRKRRGVHRTKYGQKKVYHKKSAEVIVGKIFFRRTEQFVVFSLPRNLVIDSN